MATQENVIPLRIPADLFFNPTNPDAGFNDDGTPKSGLGTPSGYNEDIAVILGERVGTVESQMEGAVLSKCVLFKTALIVVYHRGLDPDVFEAIYGSNLTNLTESTAPLVTLNGSGIFSRKDDGNSNKILLVPKERKGEVPTFLFYNAAAYLSDGQEIANNQNRDYGTKVIFEAMLDDSSRLLQYGLLQDFSV